MQARRSRARVVTCGCPQPAHRRALGCQVVAACGLRSSATTRGLRRKPRIRRRPRPTTLVLPTDPRNSCRSHGEFRGFVRVCVVLSSASAPARGLRRNPRGPGANGELRVRRRSRARVVACGCPQPAHRRALGCQVVAACGLRGSATTRGLRRKPRIRRRPRPTACGANRASGGARARRLAAQTAHQAAPAPDDPRLADGPA